MFDMARVGLKINRRLARQTRFFVWRSVHSTRNLSSTSSAITRPKARGRCHHVIHPPVVSGRRPTLPIDASLIGPISNCKL